MSKTPKLIISTIRERYLRGPIHEANHAKKLRLPFNR